MATMSLVSMKSRTLTELPDIDELINNVKTGVASYFFLNIFAPKGFGKSALLEQIWERYERELPVSKIHVDEHIATDGSLERITILKSIIDQLDYRLPKRVTQLPANYSDLSGANQLAEILLKMIDQASQTGQMILLLLDDFDAMSDVSERWFETQILSPAAQTRKVAVILTSEFEVRFADRISLRMRLESHQLPSYDLETIARFYPNYEGIAAHIYDLTGGLPLLTDKLVHQLENTKVTSAVAFQDQEEELSRKYYGTLVSEIILQDETVEMQETLQILSLLRRFDVMVLSQLMPLLLPDPYQEYDATRYLDLIEELGSRVQWRKQGGYALNDPLRIVLEGFVRFTNPRHYEIVNRAALTMYRDLLKPSQDYHEYYLVELLYHLLRILRLENGPDHAALSLAISRELRRYLYDESTAAIREAELDSLRNALAQDTHLRDYVSTDALKEIKRLIRARQFESDAFA